MNSRLSTFDAESICNNFRLQTRIDVLKVAVEAFLAEHESPTFLPLADLVETALAYSEIGDKAKCKQFVELAQRKLGLPNEPKDMESVAKLHYVQGTRLRDENQIEESISAFKDAIAHTDSDWIKSVSYRSVGLSYLKKEDYHQAAKMFEAGIQVMQSTKQSALMGGLPALLNYRALAVTRGAIKANEPVELGLAMFDEAAQSYDFWFKTLAVSQQDRDRSHDYQSHLFHRYGIIACALAEQEKAKGNHDKARAYLQEAATKLREVLEKRKLNQADGSRIGDVCVWLGKVLTNMQDIEEARTTYQEASEQYSRCFPTGAQQIAEVEKLLAGLPAPVVATLSDFSMRLMPAPSRVPAEGADSAASTKTLRQ